MAEFLYNVHVYGASMDRLLDAVIAVGPDPMAHQYFGHHETAYVRAVPASLLG